jgi:hypothetical protein
MDFLKSLIFKMGYREISGDVDKDQSVKASKGNCWYLHCLCDLVNEGKLSDVEYNNFIQSDVIGD